MLQSSIVRLNKLLIERSRRQLTNAELEELVRLLLGALQHGAKLAPTSSGSPDTVQPATPL